MITVYGLKNCDTTRKALKWLEARGATHRFHDVRADGIDLATVTGWANAVGWQVLLNTRGTTWRGLSEAVRARADEAGAAALMVEHPALIKRPVIDTGSGLIVGFKDAEAAALAAAL